MAIDYEKERAEQNERLFKLENMKFESQLIMAQQQQTTIRVVAVCILLAIVGGLLASLKGCELSAKAAETRGK